MLTYQHKVHPCPLQVRACIPTCSHTDTKYLPTRMGSVLLYPAHAMHTLADGPPSPSPFTQLVRDASISLHRTLTTFHPCHLSWSPASPGAFWEPSPCPRPCRAAQSGTRPRSVHTTLLLRAGGQGSPRALIVSVLSDKEYMPCMYVTSGLNAMYPPNSLPWHVRRLCDASYEVPCRFASHARVVPSSGWQAGEMALIPLLALLFWFP